MLAAHMEHAPALKAGACCYFIDTDDVVLGFFPAEFIEQLMNLGKVLLRSFLIKAIIGNIFVYFLFLLVFEV